MSLDANLSLSRYVLPPGLMMLNPGRVDSYSRLASLAVGVTASDGSTPIAFQYEATAVAIFSFAAPCRAQTASSKRSPLVWVSTPSGPWVQPASASNCCARAGSYGYGGI